MTQHKALPETPGRRGIRRTATILGVVAGLFYLLALFQVWMK